MTEQERNELITELFEIGLTVEQQIIVTQLLIVTNSVTRHANVTDDVTHFQPLTPSERAKNYRDRRKSSRITSRVTPVTKEEKVSHTLQKEESLPKENTPKGVQKKRVQIEFEDQFWPKYPRKIGKGGALKAFFRAREQASTEEIMAGVERLSAQKLDPQFTPHPATWLNQTRWLDEFSAQTPKPVAATSFPQPYPGKMLPGGRLEFRETKPDPPPPTPEERERRAAALAAIRKSIKPLDNGPQNKHSM